MKKRNYKGFFLVETIVVIAVVGIVITFLFRNFSNLYTRFNLGESYNTVLAINSLSNIKGYMEDRDIIYESILEGEAYIELSYVEELWGEYFDKLKDRLKVANVYLIDKNMLFSDINNLNDFNVKLREFIMTLENVEYSHVLVVEMSNAQYGYLPVFNYTLTLNGDQNNEYVTYVKQNESFIDPGYTAKDKDGNDLDVYVTGFVNTLNVGTYYLTYNLKDLTLRRKVVVYKTQYDFAYTGSFQMFKAPIDGLYQIELWGAAGGKILADSGNGGYTKGDIYLYEGETLFVYVGEAGKLGTYGINASSTVGKGGPATFNGGGKGGDAGGGSYPYANYRGGHSGGGATDVRIVAGNWKDTTSLRSRIMVSGGGGGNGGGGDPALTHYDANRGNAGGLNGQSGNVYSAYSQYTTKRGVAATQTTGASFGVGGNGSNTGGVGYCNGHSGGGGGYYGGGGALNTGGDCLIMGGGGGSSYISGHSGVNAIGEDGVHMDRRSHYSGYRFFNTVMSAGNESIPNPAGGTQVGNSGNGYARIKVLSTESGLELNKVRYIYNHINGSSANTYNHWVEIQAFDRFGNNVTQGNTNITTSFTTTAEAKAYLTNGNTNTAEYLDGSPGIQYVIIDLGKEIDLSSIRVWHYYQDGRIYNDSQIRVAGNDGVYRTVFNGTGSYKETASGFAVRSGYR